MRFSLNSTIILGAIHRVKSVMNIIICYLNWIYFIVKYKLIFVLLSTTPGKKIVFLRLPIYKINNLNSLFIVFLSLYCCNSNFPSGDQQRIILSRIKWTVSSYVFLDPQIHRAEDLSVVTSAWGPPNSITQEEFTRPLGGL